MRLMYPCVASKDPAASCLFVCNEQEAKQFGISKGVYLLFSPTTGTAHRFSFSDWDDSRDTGYILIPDLMDWDKQFISSKAGTSDMALITRVHANKFKLTQSRAIDIYKEYHATSVETDWSATGHTLPTHCDHIVAQYTLTDNELLLLALGNGTNTHQGRQAILAGAKELLDRVQTPDVHVFAQGTRFWSARVVAAVRTTAAQIGFQQ